MSADVVVIGGGIGGLAAAHRETLSSGLRAAREARKALP